MHTHGMKNAGGSPPTAIHLEDILEKMPEVNVTGENKQQLLAEIEVGREVGRASWAVMVV